MATVAIYGQSYGQAQSPQPLGQTSCLVVAARANPALSGVMTKAKAAPKMTGSRDHQDAKEESDAGEVTSQKSDEKKEDKHEKKEDKHEEKEDEHEKKEVLLILVLVLLLLMLDKHEEKTESNHQKTCSNASTTETQEHGESGGDVDESASSAAVEPTPVPEIAQAKEAPQALCLRVGMYQWPSKDNQTPMPNVYLRVGSSVDVTKTQVSKCSVLLAEVLWNIVNAICTSSQILVAI